MVMSSRLHRVSVPYGSYPKRCRNSAWFNIADQACKKSSCSLYGRLCSSGRFPPLGVGFFSCRIFSTVLAQVVTERISWQFPLLCLIVNPTSTWKGDEIFLDFVPHCFSHTCSKWKISALEPVVPAGEISHEWTSMHAGPTEVWESYNSWQCNHKVNRDTVYSTNQARGLWESKTMLCYLRVSEKVTGLMTEFLSQVRKNRRKDFYARCKFPNSKKEWYAATMPSISVFRIQSSAQLFVVSVVHPVPSPGGKVKVCPRTLWPKWNLEVGRNGRRKNSDSHWNRTSPSCCYSFRKWTCSSYMRSFLVPPTKPANSQATKLIN